MLLADAVEVEQLAQPLAQRRGVVRLRATVCGDHQVLARVLGCDELEHARLVAMNLQEQRADAVGHDLRLALGEDAVPQHLAQHRRWRELRADFFVAARRGEDERRLRADALMQRVVRSRVARVQRDEQIHRALRREVADGPALEPQPREPRLARHAVRQLHEIGPRLHADHLRIHAAVAEKSRRGESQVALARAHIQHPQFAPVAQRRVVHQMPEDLHEALNLPQLVRHPRPCLTRRRRHPERVEKRRVLHRERRALFHIVLRLRCHRKNRAARLEPAFAQGVALELPVPGRGEKMRARKLRAEQLVQHQHDLPQRHVFRHITRGIAPDERDVRPVAQVHHAAIHIAQPRLRAAVFTERDFHKRAHAQPGVEFGQEAGAWGFGHGRRMWNGERRMSIGPSAPPPLLSGCCKRRTSSSP